MLLEACLEGIASAIMAEEGGAGRVELCENLVVGGTTPSVGMMAVVKQRLTIPVHVMIRPRGGDFCYSDLEFEIMLQDVAAAKRTGVDGVVFGMLTEDKEIDMERTAVLINQARPLSITFHRAFDEATDPFATFDTLIDLGVDRILTSGQKPTAWQGRELIKELVKKANGRISILPAAGINAQNAAQLVAETGVTEIHAGSACVGADGIVSVDRVQELVNVT